MRKAEVESFKYRYMALIAAREAATDAIDKLLKDAKKEGRDSGMAGVADKANPFTPGSRLNDTWQEGFRDGYYERRRHVKATKVSE